MTPQTNPSPLAKALGRGVTIPGAFFDDDDYLDYVDSLERNWYLNQSKIPRLKQWVEIDPQVKNVFKEIITDKTNQKEILTTEIKNRIKDISTIKNPIWKLILTEKIRCVEGEKLEDLARDIKRLKLAIIDTSHFTNSLTDDQIQEAREFPLEDILETKRIRNMWCCPFHEEDTPSFHIYKNNSWHCFGCQAHGSNAVDYVIKKNNLGFVEAVKFLIGK